MFNPLKLATRHLVEKVGGLAKAEEASRLRKARIQQCYSLNHEAFLPIDVVADLEGQVEFPYVTKCLADFKFLALTPIDPGFSSGVLELEVLELTRKFSALMESYHSGLSSGGFIDKNEAKELLNASRNMQAAMIQLKHQLFKVVNE